ncbi:uncharacterized protein A4U43_C07F11160 [Asparagus officinalis]|uniref:Uncharacterized protein n=1 Tax=Asparagus officinalis TaxID=4686 RepID=A0A5P1EB07_ASPOF|nr:uncharacterized protein A4U43_C07F11160 [Asparagus officinalis]
MSRPTSASSYTSTMADSEDHPVTARSAVATTRVFERWGEAMGIRRGKARRCAEVELYAEKVNNRGLCAIAQAESLRYKLLGGLAVRRYNFLIIIGPLLDDEVVVLSNGASLLRLGLRCAGVGLRFQVVVAGVSNLALHISQKTLPWTRNLLPLPLGTVQALLTAKQQEPTMTAANNKAGYSHH